MRRSWAALATCALVTLGALTQSAGNASAQPSESSTTPTGQAVSFRELGRPVDLRIPVDSTATNVTVPVPDGLTAGQLTGTVVTPTDYREGWIEVQSEGRLVQRIDIPGGTAERGVPLTIPLGGLRVVDRSVTLQLVSHYLPLDDRCYDRSPFAAMTLRDTSVSYSGTERQPVTPAEFLPPMLRKATIHLTDSASTVQQNAALALSTALTNHYGSQPTRMELAELQSPALPDASPAPFERNIVIGGPGAEITLESGPSGAAVLLIPGDGPALTSQMDLLITNLAGYSSASASVLPPERTVPEIAQDALSLYQLGMGSLTAAGTNRIELPVAIDQTQLGRPISSLSAHLRGTYVPLPAARSGVLTVGMNGMPLTSAPLDSSGTFDVVATVPRHLLSRYMTLTVAIEVTGEFQCGAIDESSLTIDPLSTITSQLASPPLPGGFASLPQSLLPTVDVGLSKGDFADLVRADKLLVQMQRSSYLPLQPRIQPFDSAVTGPLPAVLVAADGYVPESVDEPLDSADSPVLALRGVSSSSSFGNVQVVEQPRRTVVLASSTGDPADLDGLLDWLTADAGRLPSLTGDVLIGPRGQEPFTIGVKVAEVTAEAVNASDNGLSGVALATVAAVTAAVAAAAVGVTLWLRRRRS
ncbi:cellulose biosynthesis cyclic di-GMP-binding regulatory protein BcsB [Rhodococcus sp. OK519]|uniref:cellulose biosynthesis cyclic di-GMP-binding regulatory protein BcsB n=1 Tax=Rhodococcus sp. OK519 TaxID=2135729 RepID=UPI0015E6F958